MIARPSVQGAAYGLTAAGLFGISPPLAKLLLPQAGPLLIEVAAIYTSGNTADDRIDLNRSRLKYFEPISTDNGFYAGWAEMQASGVDYFNRIRYNGGASVQPGVAMGSWATWFTTRSAASSSALSRRVVRMESA